jgi:hypothetical protein
MALIATAFERPIGPYLLAKVARACELWNAGDKALAHIHLAHANLPACGEGEALRLFAADELLGSGVTPQELFKAQGFDPVPLALLKYNPDQPRVPAGHGRESGRWTSEDASEPQGLAAAPEAGGGPVAGDGADASIILVSDEKDRNYEERRARGEESPKEDIEHGRGVPLLPEGPLVLPPSEGATGTGELQLPKLDPNKLHHIFDDPDHDLNVLLDEFGSPESAFDAVAAATRDAIKLQGITGQFEIQVEIGGQTVTVRGRVYNGIINIGTVFIPWAH